MKWQELFYSIEVPAERRKRFKELIKRRFKCDTWTTNEGNVIPVKVMRDSHLRNAWHHIVRECRKAFAEHNYTQVLRRSIQADLLNNELIRRNNTWQSADYKLTEIWGNEADSILYPDYDDGYPLDHYEAYRAYTGKG